MRTVAVLNNIVVGLGLLAGLTTPAFEATHASEILYLQDFEHPSGFVNDAADVNIHRSVNDLYGDQPPGFSFAQDYTVETLLVTGTAAFGTGYADPSGKGGNYVLGMRSFNEDDLIALSFDVGRYEYLNLGLIVSNIDLSAWGGPVVPEEGVVPTFQFTLFDNPTGAVGLSGNGNVLDQATASGTASPRAVFDWTEVVVALDASGSSNGNITLQIDLLEGEYAALDNIVIVASDGKGDFGPLVPHL